jgi:uncharacterized membrane protein
MDGDAPVFQAMIVPHRSLSRRGLVFVMLALALVCCINVTVSVRIHAWPVGGFAGIELFVAGFLLRRNARDARASEFVMLSDAGLRIVRTDVRGRRQERLLAPGWLNVDLQDRPGRVPALLLCTHGRSEEIARALGEDEKRDLAAALAEALHRWRNPRFDNPQLRD